MLQYEMIEVSDGIDIYKKVHQNDVCFVNIGILKMLDLNLNQMFVINIMMYQWLLWIKKQCIFECQCCWL